MWKIRRLIYAFVFYCTQSVKWRKHDPQKKVVYFNRKDWVFFQRYTYILAKYFLIEGFEVYFPRDFRQVYHFGTEIDCGFLLKEKDVFFRKLPKGITPKIELNYNNISPEYFQFMKSNKEDSRNFRIPIGFHPYHYFKQFSLPKIDIIGNRLDKIFFMGNFNNKSYDLNYNEEIFNVPSRLKHFQYFKKNLLIHEIYNDAELQNILEKNDLKFKNPIYQVNSFANFSIDPSQVKQVISRFNFYFAYPGMYMPLCHNLIEAMSVGSIPIIHRNYVKLLQPSLKNLENCIIYNQLTDLPNVFDYCFQLNLKTIIDLRRGVLRYYEKNFSSKSIVKKMLNEPSQKFYLMAELESLKLVMNGKRN